MNETLTQTRSDINSAALISIRRLLLELGIPSALLSPEGVCLSDPFDLAGTSDSLCGDWRQCFTQIACDRGIISPDLNPFETSCPQDHHSPRCAAAGLMIVPIIQRRKTVALLCCCLKTLQFNDSESLQRLCSKLKIDSSLLFEHGLRDAVNGPITRQILQKLLQLLIEKAQTSHDNIAEMEALGNSLSQSYEELTLLHTISDSMKVNQKPETFFDQLCQNLIGVIKAQKLVVLCPDNHQSHAGVSQVATAGQPQLEPALLEMLWHRTVEYARKNEGVLIDSNVDSPYTYKWPAPIRNIVCVPLHRDQNVIGALIAINKTGKPDFDSVDTKLLISVANECAVYLQNFHLYDDMQELLLGSLRALTSSIDAKDTYTCGHSERVAMISRRLAEQLALSAKEINNMYFAGLLHDVGKIGISDKVLCKTGRLSADEYAQMQKHPQIGADILRGIKQISEVGLAVLTHHERFDGTGYPHGLAGTDIPLAGRIVQLADSFDAMISHRTYRTALPLNAAIAEIIRFSGTQFDPHLVDLFLQNDIPQFIRDIQTVNTDQLRKNPFHAFTN